jgi:hypothetical protein
MLEKYQHLECNISIIRIIIKHTLILYEFSIMNVNIFCYIFSKLQKGWLWLLPKHKVIKMEGVCNEENDV